jgi:hypothetical protein
MMKNFLKRGVWAAIVAIFLGVGIQISLSKKNLKTTTSVTTTARIGIARDPAAIRKNFDFSGLEGDALSQASKQRLVSGAVVTKSGSEVGVGLGDFVVATANGQKAFACQKYSVVELTFEGDGSAVNGVKPEMQVEGNCEVSADINSISPLWIPVAKILGEPVADGEFDFRENHPVRVRFANVVGAWPTAWRLKGMRMVDPEHPGQEVQVSDDELGEMMNKPLILNFTK